MSIRKITRCIFLTIFIALILAGSLQWTSAAVSPEKTLAAQPAADPLARAPFPVDIGPGDQENPAIVYNSQHQEFLAAYNVSGGTINIARLSNTGAVLFNDPPVTYAFNGESPALAYNSAADQYLLVWCEGADIKMTRFNGIGELIIPTVTISTPGIAWSVAHPAVDFNVHGSWENFLVVWEAEVQKGAVTTNIVMARRVAGVSGAGDGGGEFIGGEFEIASSTTEWNTEPDVAYNLNHNEFLVVYTRDSSMGINPQVQDVYGTLINASGGVMAEHAIDNAGMGQYAPVVAAYRLNQATPYLVIYTDNGDPQGSVWGQLVDVAGNPSGGVLSIGAIWGTPEGEPDIASSEALGGYTVAWSRFDGDWDIYVRRVSNTGNMEDAINVSVCGNVLIGCNEQSPAVAGGSPVTMTLWQDGCFPGSAGGWDIAGRLLGYWIYLPLVVR